MIYRGFEINETVNGKYRVLNDFVQLGVFDTADIALSAVDTYKRAEAAKASAPNTI